MMAPASLYFLQVAPVGKILALDLDSLKSRVIVDGLNTFPDGIAVDLEKGLVYWTNMGPHKEARSLEFFQADGSLESVQLNGSGRRTLVGDGLFVTGKQLVQDKRTGRLYWCDREGMRVFRAEADGSNPTVLVKRGVFPRDAGDYTRHCVGIAIDPDANTLYWTQKGPAKGGQGRIFRAPLELPAGQSAQNREDIELLADGLPEPIDLELSPDRRTLYWTDRGDDRAGGNSLNRALIEEGVLTHHQILAKGFKETIGLAMDHARGLAYITDLSGKLYRHTLSRPGSLEVVASLGPLTGVTLA